MLSTAPRKPSYLPACRYIRCMDFSASAQPNPLPPLGSLQESFAPASMTASERAQVLVVELTQIGHLCLTLEIEHDGPLEGDAAPLSDVIDTALKQVHELVVQQEPLLTAEMFRANCGNASAVPSQRSAGEQLRRRMQRLALVQEHFPAAAPILEAMRVQFTSHGVPATLLNDVEVVPPRPAQLRRLRA